MVTGQGQRPDPHTPSGLGWGSPVAPRRRWSWLFLVPFLVFSLAAGLLAWVAFSSSARNRFQLAHSTQPGRTATGDPQAPTPGREEAAAPLGRPSPPAHPSSSYRFMVTQQDGKTPVAYDPCRPIHFVVRAKGAPPGGRRLLEQAIGQVSAATGLRFVDDGGTTESPRSQRKAFQPKRYGNRWVPALIAWETAKENPDFASDMAGEAGSTRVEVPGRPAVYVTGQVQLDATKIRRLLAEPGGVAVARGLIDHELGHLVGLGHVKDRTQVMYPRVVHGVTGYRGGDRTGLALLGAGPCAPFL